MNRLRSVAVSEKETENGSMPWEENEENRQLFEFFVPMQEVRRFWTEGNVRVRASRRNDRVQPAAQEARRG